MFNLTWIVRFPSARCQHEVDNWKIAARITRKFTVTIRSERLLAELVLAQGNLTQLKIHFFGYFNTQITDPSRIPRWLFVGAKCHFNEMLILLSNGFQGGARLGWGTPVAENSTCSCWFYWTRKGIRVWSVAQFTRFMLSWHRINCPFSRFKGDTFPHESQSKSTKTWHQHSAA